ncbi:7012_t:CDS:2, partial [Racocetra persica]
WKQLSGEEYMLRNDRNNVIQDLQGNESKLDEYYHMLEPWWLQSMSSLLSTDLGHSRYSFVLDEKKEKLLLIGNHSIQVWYDKESIHIPQKFPWSGEKNAIRTAFSDHTMLALFLEYYSNNVLENIGWMNTVVDIIPELYKSNEKKNEKREGDNINENEIDLKQNIIHNKKNGKEKDDNIYEDVMDFKSESYAYHAQKLFYNPCFCNKPLDLLSFEFLEISPASNDLLKVFIPITQLIPQDSELDLQEIDYDKMVDIRMVPLTDFTTKKKSLFDVKESKRTSFLDFLKFLNFPNQYLSHEVFKEEDYSPFIRLIWNLIKKDEFESLYENPSMGAVMNWI